MNALGCDISKWQPGFDFQRARAAGLSFVILKATDGLSTDPQFQAQRERAVDSGLTLGAYHWFQPKLSPTAQADYFLSTVRPTPGLLLALDLEEKRGASYRLPDRVYEFVRLITAAVPNRLLFYTSPGYWNSWLTGALWAVTFPLWIAHYRVAAPLVPLPWAPTRWMLWQFTDRANGPFYGTDPARSKSIDLNVFNGSETELRAFAGAG